MAAITWRVCHLSAATPTTDCTATLSILNPHPRIYFLIDVRKTENERKKHRSVAYHTCPNWWSNPQPGYMTWPRIELAMVLVYGKILQLSHLNKVALPLYTGEPCILHHGFPLAGCWDCRFSEGRRGREKERRWKWGGKGGGGDGKWGKVRNRGNKRRTVVWHGNTEKFLKEVEWGHLGVEVFVIVLKISCITKFVQWKESER